MNFDEELRRAFDTLTERVRGEIDREGGRRPPEQSAILAEQLASVPEVSSVETPAPVPSNDTSLERLTAAFDSIDGARSLTGILDALETRARDEPADASVW